MFVQKELTRKDGTIVVGSNRDSQGRKNFKPYCYLRVNHDKSTESISAFLTFTPAEAIAIGMALIAHGENRMDADAGRTS